MSVKGFLFNDAAERECELSEASTTELQVWLGLAGQDRMLLTQKQAAELAVRLKRFAQTGSIEE